MCARTLTSQKVVNTDQGADGQHRRDDLGAIEASYDTSPRLPAHRPCICVGIAAAARRRAHLAAILRPAASVVLAWLASGAVCLPLLRTTSTHMRFRFPLPVVALLEAWVEDRTKIPRSALGSDPAQQHEKRVAVV